MKITDQEVMRIAGLARLRFSPDERVELALQLNHILKHFESLTELDTAEVELLMHDAQSAAVLRPDDVRPCLARDTVFCNAPEQEKNLFKVPKIIKG